MERLSTFDHLCHIEEKAGCTLQGDLVCSCENEWFSLFYFGKQTKGILSPDIVRKQKTLFLEGRCFVCGAKITIFDSASMGSSARGAKNNPSTTNGWPLMPFGIRPYKIKVLYNYMPSNLYSVNFEEIYVEAKASEATKWKRIVEDS
ncbi:MAG: hypothetical protein V1761_05790 [bacterium]